MSERQFRLYFQRAEKKKGITGENLLQMLERRLDNVVFLSGYAHSRAHARQLITHGHYRINGKKVNVPSQLVNVGNVLSFRDKSKKHEELKAIVDFHKSKAVPSWLDVDRDNMEVKVLAFPEREEIPIPVEEHLVIELYSK
jgi:small subunit ribosomal protein S4